MALSSGILSIILTSCPSLSNRIAKWLPINPPPPVMMNLVNMACSFLPIYKTTITKYILSFGCDVDLNLKVTRYDILL